MTYDFNYQILPDDVPTMQAVTIGPYFRQVTKCIYGSILAFNLYLVATEPSAFLSWVMVVLSVIMLFDITLLYRPYFLFREANARVRIDRQNLTSSVGEKDYRIPWRYFAERGSVVEASDHFYLKCKLGNVFLPKRAFSDDQAIGRFRDEISLTMGDRFASET